MIVCTVDMASSGSQSGASLAIVRYWRGSELGPVLLGFWVFGLGVEILY
jgi:hypothetical protein